MFDCMDIRKMATMLFLIKELHPGKLTVRTLKIGLNAPKGKERIVFQPSIFRCELSRAELLWWSIGWCWKRNPMGKFAKHKKKNSIENSRLFKQKEFEIFTTTRLNIVSYHPDFATWNSPRMYEKTLLFWPGWQGFLLAISRWWNIFSKKRSWSSFMTAWMDRRNPSTSCDDPKKCQIFSQKATIIQ